jgi:hypothetical protein
VDFRCGDILRSLTNVCLSSYGRDLRDCLGACWWKVVINRFRNRAVGARLSVERTELTQALTIVVTQTVADHRDWDAARGQPDGLHAADVETPGIRAQIQRPRAGGESSCRLDRIGEQRQDGVSDSAGTSFSNTSCAAISLDRSTRGSRVGLASTTWKPSRSSCGLTVLSPPEKAVDAKGPGSGCWYP